MSEEDIRQIIPEALYEARKRFNEVLFDKHGYDPAYCSIRFTAWLMDSNYEQRLARFEIEEEVND